MMQPVHRIDGRNASATAGRVQIDWSKTLWNGGMGLAFIVLTPVATTPTAILLFLPLLWFSLLIGHSVGMHRLMIHRSLDVHAWVEKLLIYVGVLVGMGGPSAIMQVHDIRDWAQRQAHCHDFFAHRKPYPKDMVWQLFCRFEFERAPTFTVEERYNTGFYRFLDRTWRWHQLPLAIFLYAIGGLPFVIWGICGRVFMGVFGHWTITYFCHRPGAGHWRVKTAAVQASNLNGLGWLTFGECWHNNHHAFPESPRIGLEAGQSDPGWSFIKMLDRLGLVIRLGVPRDKSEQDDLSFHGTYAASNPSVSI
jgi:fatty-acid desaturase